MGGAVAVMKRDDKKHAVLIFGVTFFAALLILIISVVENYILFVTLPDIRQRNFFPKMLPET